MYFEIFSGKLEPPNSALEENANEVENPEDRGTCNEKNDCENDTEHVSVRDALYEAVYLPNDGYNRETEENLNDKGEIVDCFDKIFHSCVLLCKL